MRRFGVASVDAGWSEDDRSVSSGRVLGLIMGRYFLVDFMRRCTLITLATNVQTGADWNQTHFSVASKAQKPRKLLCSSEGS